jgi:hypothetical protein
MPLTRTRLASSTTRPGTKKTPQVRKRRPQQKIKLTVGFGKPLDKADIAKRKKQFERQQRENKAKARSLVRRDVARGRQASSRVTFKRGTVGAQRLKQFAEIGNLEVVTDSRGRRMEKRVTSSWVSMIHLVMLRNGPALAITFRKSGFVALYPTTNITDYESMSRAASKGGWIWAVLYHGKPGRGVPYQSIGFLGG